MRGRTAALLAAACLSAPVARAQSRPAEGAVAAGVEYRSYSFDPGFGTRAIRQVSIPVGAMVPFGRFTLDVGSAFASTTLETADGAKQTVSKLTDTQVRGTYTFGRDLVVATVLLNLPTGPSRQPPDAFGVLGSVSSSFLAFPVASYGNGFSATGGLAVALPAGAWNIGLAAGVRVSGEFTPYTEPNGDPLTYSPGVEGRFRIGVDRLVGAARVLAGFTFSSFGTDEFSSGGAQTGIYRPGNRWIAEAGVIAPVGNASLNLYAWHYHRLHGDSLGGTIDNRELLTTAGARLSLPVARQMALSVFAEGKSGRPGSDQAEMIGGGVGLNLRLTERIALVPTARLDTGRLQDPSGTKANFTGMYLSVFLRGSF